MRGERDREQPDAGIELDGILRLALSSEMYYVADKPVEQPAAGLEEGVSRGEDPRIRDFEIDELGRTSA